MARRSYFSGRLFAVTDRGGRERWYIEGEFISRLDIICQRFVRAF
jgi:hypothetical protein